MGCFYFLVTRLRLVTHRRPGSAWRTGDVNMSDPSIEAKLARLEELEHQFAEAVEHAKLEAMKEVAYGAGHEINNPLANIATRAQTLLQEETDPEKRRKLAAINAQAFRAHEMIADLMLFARPPQLRPEDVNVGSLLSRVARKLQAEADAANIRVAVHPPQEPVQVFADPVQLAVVIRALCINAIQAMPKGGQIDLSVRRREGDAPAEPKTQSGSTAWQEPRPPEPCAPENPQSGTVEITVADNGPGIPTDIRPKIFDPFFSGREAGRGLGFGLSKAWRLVTLHGGTIEVRETPGGGATFVIVLPSAPSQTQCLENGP
jgi:signal transduction histidine kinase